MADNIIGIIKKALKKEEKIRFSYLFGSFIKEKKYADIDIGIYIYPLLDDVFLITSELKQRISRELMKKNINLTADNIDIVILNLISFKFLNRVFKEGKLIFDKDPGFRTYLIEKNSIDLRECVGVLKESEIL